VDSDSDGIVVDMSMGSDCNCKVASLPESSGSAGIFETAGVVAESLFSGTVFGISNAVRLGSGCNGVASEADSCVAVPSLAEYAGGGVMGRDVAQGRVFNPGKMGFGMASGFGAGVEVSGSCASGVCGCDSAVIRLSTDTPGGVSCGSTVIGLSIGASVFTSTSRCVV
jgi:hypothetical protein